MPFSQLTAGRTVEILLVEDNPGDARLMREAFKESGLVGNLHVARDGEQALAFLRQEGAYVNSPRPAFILLDLNLPGMHGSEVLAHVKANESLRQIPVFILSTSTRSEDINAAYHLHANCYIPKPVDLGRLLEIGKIIESFWLGTVALPRCST